jgi:hypothetical protein
MILSPRVDHLAVGPGSPLGASGRSAPHPGASGSTFNLDAVRLIRKLHFFRRRANAHCARTSCVTKKRKGRHLMPAFINLFELRSRRWRSGFLRRMRYAPAFRTDRLAREQLAWSAPGGSTGRTGSWSKRRPPCASDRSPCWRLPHNPAPWPLDHPVTGGRSAARANRGRPPMISSNHRRTGSHLEKSTTRFDIFLIRHGQASVGDYPSARAGFAAMLRLPS